MLFYIIGQKAVDWQTKAASISSTHSLDALLTHQLSDLFNVSRISSSHQFICMRVCVFFLFSPILTTTSPTNPHGERKFIELKNPSTVLQWASLKNNDWWAKMEGECFVKVWFDAKHRTTDLGIFPYKMLYESWTSVKQDARKRVRIKDPLDILDWLNNTNI